MPGVSALALDYAFVATPYPIRASAAGGNPNTMTLQVLISNGSPDVVTLSRITIEIPTGEQASRDLSTAPNLPAPTYDTTGAWKISATGEIVTIAPTSGDTGTVTSPIIFTLPGILVNQTPGTVPITVTEFPPPPPPKVVDDTSYSLLKQPADFPVTSFSATPAIVTDLDQPVTLSWTCSDQGKQDVFGLRATVQAPAPPGITGNGPTGLRNCIDDGVCYTWQDGEAGVVVPGVNQTTIYSIDVVQADSAGHRTIVATLSTMVRVDVPMVSQDSYLTQRTSWGQVALHWLAFNARRCAVSVNGTVVDADAPPDTYLSGYPLAIAGGAGTYQVSVTAYAAFGSARATHLFQNVVLGPAVSIPTGASPSAVAITPDGALALVTNIGAGTVTVVDLAKRHAESTAIPVGAAPKSVGITPDGALALVAISEGTFSGAVAIIDLAKRQAEPEPIVLPVSESVLTWSPNVVRVTPDGKLALVGNFFGGQVAVVDVAQRRVEPKLLTVSHPGVTADIAITPDGALALVLDSPWNRVMVFDIASRTAEPTPIPVGFEPMAIAITPDGSLALVASARASIVTVIDIASHTAEPKTISVVKSPTSIAITPDGSTAIVASADVYEMTMIDIPSRAAMTGASPGQANGYCVQSVAVTPDGASLLTLNHPANRLEIL